MSRCRSGQQGTLCIRKYRCDYVLPPLLSTGQMAMNADLLAPGSKVFYLRGTTGERVPATVVGLSSFPECVAISYERSGHTQLYKDCPVERLTFPIERAESPASEGSPSPPPTAAVEAEAVAADVREPPETETLNVAPQDDIDEAPPGLESASESDNENDSEKKAHRKRLCWMGDFRDVPMV